MEEESPVLDLVPLPFGHEPFDKLRALNLPKRLRAEWLVPGGK